MATIRPRHQARQPESSARGQGSIGVGHEGLLAREAVELNSSTSETEALASQLLTAAHRTTSLDVTARGNPGTTLFAYRDMQSQARSILEAATHGPLQSLTDREMDVREQPLAIYPHALQRRVKAWVRFEPTPVRVDAKLVRSTPLAAGIEFRAEEQTFRCWAWGNAVVLDDDQVS